MKNKKSEVIQPDFVVEKNPVFYVCITDKEMFNEIAKLLDAVVADEWQLLITREELTAQIAQAVPEDYNPKPKCTDRAINMLKKIDGKLGNFGGDVWFYR